MAEQGLAIHRVLRENHRGEPIFTRNYAISLARLADHSCAAGKTKEAIGLYRDSLEFLEPLASAEATPLSLRDLLGVRHRLVDALTATGQLAEATRLANGCCETLERLIAADPANPQWRIDTALLWQRLGERHEQARDVDSTLDAYRAGIKCLPRPAGPEDRPRQEIRRRCALCFKMAQLLQGEKRPQEALEILLSIIPDELSLWIEDQKHPTFGQDLFGLRWRIAEAFAAVGETDNAIGNYRTCSGLIRELPPEQRETATALHNLAMVHFELARLLLKTRAREPGGADPGFPFNLDTPESHLSIVHGITVRMRELGYTLDPFLQNVINKLEDQ